MKDQNLTFNTKCITSIMFWLNDFNLPQEKLMVNALQCMHLWGGLLKLLSLIMRCVKLLCYIERVLSEEVLTTFWITTHITFCLCLNQVELVSFFLIELCLVEYEMLRFPPSMLAAAAIFTAQCTLGVSKEWNKTCEKHSSYVKDQLL